MHWLPFAGVPTELCAQWLSTIPRLLWELRNRLPSLTGLLLQTLLSVSKFANVGSAVYDTLAALEPQLAPFFYFPSAAVTALTSNTASLSVVPSPKVKTPYCRS